MRTTFNPWFGSAGQDGGTLTLRGADASYQVIRLAHEGRRDLVELEDAVRIHPPPVWRRTAAFVQRSGRLRGQRVVRGIVAFQPVTGNFMAALGLSQRQVRWTSLLGWSSPRTLLLAVSDGPTGAIAAWNPSRGALALHTRLPGRGLHIEAALDQVAQPCHVNVTGQGGSGD